MEYIQARNQTLGRNGRQIRGIVIHTIVGSASSCISWFTSPNNTVSSAHYVIGQDGRTVQMVRDENMAWHAGRQRDNKTIFQSGNPNWETIGIEHDDGGNPGSGHRSDALYAASGRLVRDLCKKHGIPLDRRHIVNHREIFSAKTCPGNLDIDRIINIAKGEQPQEPTMEIKDARIESRADANRYAWKVLNDGADPGMDSIRTESRQIEDGKLSQEELTNRWKHESLMDRARAFVNTWYVDYWMRSPESADVVESWAKGIVDRGYHGFEWFIKEVRQYATAEGWVRLSEIAPQHEELTKENTELSTKLTAITAEYETLKQQSADMLLSQQRCADQVATLTKQLDIAKQTNPMALTPGEMILLGVQRLLGIK